jgi:DNA-binding NarL/FixJ family response regulator
MLHIFRFGLRALLDAEACTEVVDEAKTGREAVDLAASLEPSVVLMDINMPELNGIEATRRIVADRPGTAVLIITMFDDDRVFAAMRAGARGYLLKGAEGEETIRAIRVVAGGEAIFSPKAAERLIKFFAAASQDAVAPAFADLTPRELEILSPIAQGLKERPHRRPVLLPDDRHQLLADGCRFSSSGLPYSLRKPEQAGRPARIATGPSCAPVAEADAAVSRGCKMLRTATNRAIAPVAVGMTAPAPSPIANPL